MDAFDLMASRDNGRSRHPEDRYRNPSPASSLANLGLAARGRVAGQVQPAKSPAGTAAPRADSDLERAKASVSTEHHAVASRYAPDFGWESALVRVWCWPGNQQHDTEVEPPKSVSDVGEYECVKRSDTHANTCVHARTRAHTLSAALTNASRSSGAFAFESSTRATPVCLRRRFYH